MSDEGDSGIPAMDYSLVGEEHVRRYQETDGAVGGVWNGAPCLLLTTNGRRTGKERTTPMIYGEHDGDYVVIASVGGAPKHPSWYLNLRADPNVGVQILGDRFHARAREAIGAERETLWALMTKIWPSYDVYASRTTRVIPVVVLEPSI